MKFALALLSLLTLPAHAIMSDEDYTEAMPTMEVVQTRLIGSWQCQTDFNSGVEQIRTQSVMTFLPTGQLTVQKTVHHAREDGTTATYRTDTERSWAVGTSDGGKLWTLMEQLQKSTHFEKGTLTPEAQKEIQDFINTKPVSESVIVLDKADGKDTLKLMLPFSPVLADCVKSS